MKFVESDIVQSTIASFGDEWGSRHTEAPPPALPARRDDPMWSEANDLMTSSLQRATMAHPDAASALHGEMTAATWTALPGWILCPNNHSFDATSNFCPQCGQGPVPPWVQGEAQRKQDDLNNRAAMVWLRQERLIRDLGTG